MIGGGFITGVGWGWVGSCDVCVCVQLATVPSTHLVQSKKSPCQISSFNFSSVH